MERNQKKLILTVIAFFICAAAFGLGIHFYDLHLRRVAEHGPAAVDSVTIVHRADGSPALLTVAPIHVRQHRGRGAAPFFLHRLELIDAASGERLVRRTWDDDSWPRCRDAGPGRLRCRSTGQNWHTRSLADLNEIEGGVAEAPATKPRVDGGDYCKATRAPVKSVVFRTRRAETSVREVLVVDDAEDNELRTCAEPELIAPQFVCDEVTEGTLDIGVENAVLVDHRNTLLEGADHTLAVIDSACHAVWQRDLGVPGEIAFARPAGDVLVVLASQTARGEPEAHLFGIDLATGTVRWQR